MNRHFKCVCGGTAWIDREDGWVSIHCQQCGKGAGGETLALAKDEWRFQQSQLRKKDPDSKKIYKSGR